MQIIADLQIHSRFSRAVSKEMTIANIAQWARRKGIGLMATGDWTHPMWFREIEENLEEVGNGLLKLKNAQGDENFFGSSKILSPFANPLFLLATEVSSIYTQKDKVRRVHTLIWVPSLESARKISQEMTRRGCNLLSDGRPIIGLSSIEVAELVLSIEPKALIIPAHAWTPWFSVYGSLGGFDSIEEAFGPFAKNIYAVETGLSSDPAMNWRIKELDNRSIVSFSDAHSGPKIGREATVFDLPELNYENIYKAIRANQGSLVVSSVIPSEVEGSRAHARSDKLRDSSAPLRSARNDNDATSRISYTIEFHPEEGKYHYTGHRICNVRLTPQDSKKKGITCPVCGKPLTQGVMQRIEELAGRSEESLQILTVKLPISNGETIDMVGSKIFPNRPPYVMLVPLQEIISESIGSPVTSPRVQVIYQKLTDGLSGEFNVLLQANSEEIRKLAGDRIAEGVVKVRKGDIVIDPGYDGVFGVVKIWKEGEEKPLLDASKEQLSIF